MEGNKQFEKVPFAKNNSNFGLSKGAKGRPFVEGAREEEGKREGGPEEGGREGVEGVVLDVPEEEDEDLVLRRK